MIERLGTQDVVRDRFRDFIKRAILRGVAHEIGVYETVSTLRLRAIRYGLSLVGRVWPSAASTTAASSGAQVRYIHNAV